MECPVLRVVLARLRLVWDGYKRKQRKQTKRSEEYFIFLEAALFVREV
jgi:hypothetical protein